jgi:CheY-like chemotaxis protein
MRFVRDAARIKGLDLVCRISDNVPDALFADSLRIRQVLTNLLGNAVKFTEQGSIELRVECCLAKPGTVKLKIAVADTGVGITPEKQETIFQAFRQADSSTTRQYGGSGLGLTISARLADLMGGSIKVTSAPGRGSTFHFTVPCSLAAPESLPQPVPCVSAGSAEPCRPLRILLAEDNPVNQRLAHRLLQKRGHKVSVAGDGQQAVEAAAHEEEIFDLILMDVQMPGMDGFEATRAIRSLPNPERRSIPIVALTAFAMKGDRERCLKAGMDGYVTKPIDPGELCATIERIAASRVGEPVS